MHGRLFEIREERLPREEWMNEGSFYEEETSSWCDWMQDSEDRKEDLKWLKDSLPSSIFKVRGDVIEIISDGKEYIEEWIAKVKEEVSKLDYDTFTKGAAMAMIKYRMANIITADFMFYTSFAGYPHNSTEFIRDCVSYHVGKKFYVCGIIDYHY